MPQKIFLSINYCNGELPIVIKNSVEYVPLDQLCEITGVDWISQKNKFLACSNFEKRFGLLIEDTKIPVRGKLSCFKGVWLMRYDCISFFLSNLKANELTLQNSDDKSLWLIKRQVEWAEILCAFPPCKKLRAKTLELNYISRLANQLKKCANKNEKKLVENFIQNRKEDLGLSPNDFLKAHVKNNQTF